MELRETFYSDDLTESHVDADKFVIRNVRILGSVSKNGRTYSEAAMRKAAGLYEGARLNFNHLDRRDAGKERHFEDWIGEIRDVHYVPAEKALRGDAHILQSDPRTPKLLEAAKRFPRSFGLSHVASGVEGPGRIVDQIEAVASVDIVTTPATNVGLFESEDSEMARAKKPVKRKVRELAESAQETKLGQVLIEMMDASMMPPEMEVEAPEESSPEDSMRSAAISAITSKIEAASSDEIASLLQALGMEDSISSILGGGGSSEAPAEPAAESANEAARMNLLESENLLLKAGREASPERIQAVASVPKETRQKLVESWPAKVLQESRQRPAQSPPAKATSSTAADRARAKWYSK